jgi:16S rRNA G527 N7-methylase RsmG
MVESKTRKAAFLREVVRLLPLPGAEVFNARLEDFLAEPEHLSGFDLASIRAVRADRDLWTTLGRLVRPDGLVLWFRSESDAAGPDPVFFPQFLMEAVFPLIPAAGSELAVLRKLTT